MDTLKTVELAIQATTVHRVEDLGKDQSVKDQSLDDPVRILSLLSDPGRVKIRDLKTEEGKIRTTMDDLADRLNLDRLVRVHREQGPCLLVRFTVQ